MTCPHETYPAGYEEVEVTPWGDTELEWVQRTKSAQEDFVTGTFRCSMCGEVGFFTGSWKRFYLTDEPCPSSSLVSAVDVAKVKLAIAEYEFKQQRKTL